MHGEWVKYARKYARKTTGLCLRYATKKAKYVPGFPKMVKICFSATLLYLRTKMGTIKFGKYTKIFRSSQNMLQKPKICMQHTFKTIRALMMTNQFLLFHSFTSISFDVTKILAFRLTHRARSVNGVCATTQTHTIQRALYAQ